MHAGKLLADWLEKTKVNKTDFGAYIGLSSARVSQLQKRETFSPQLALAIYYATGGDIPVSQTCPEVFAFEPFQPYLDYIRHRVAQNA